MKCILLSLGLAVTPFVFNSCVDSDGYSLDDAWYSVATIRTTGNEGSASYWLTLDSGTSLWPVATDVPWYRSKDRQRAFVIYTILSDKFSGYDHAVKVLDVKNILTKPVVEDLGEENDEMYGTDPVGISEMWIGDGFLNIKFEFNYGGEAVHFINLMKNASVRTPHFYEFRHNAYNDSERYRRKAIVAFDLSSIDTMGEDVELTIQVNTFDGTKDFKIKYNSSRNTSVQNRNLSMDSFVEMK
jgi:hypothetical protein